MLELCFITKFQKKGELSKVWVSKSQEHQSVLSYLPERLAREPYTHLMPATGRNDTARMWAGSTVSFLTPKVSNEWASPLTVCSESWVDHGRLTKDGRARETSQQKSSWVFPLSHSLLRLGRDAGFGTVPYESLKHTLNSY